MSFSARSRTSFGSFILGTGIDFFAVLVTAILSVLFNVQFPGLALLLAVAVGVLIWLLGIRIFHWVWFWVGILFGLFIILIIAVIIIAIIGVAAYTILTLLFGVHP